VITPRRTRLVRVPDLHALRRAVTVLASDSPHDLFPSAAIVVPTRGAAHQLRRALRGGSQELVTRDGLYDTFHARLAAPPRRLAPCEREVMLHAAAVGAVAAGAVPPFEVRPGLVAEMMRFYDQLRRQGQSVDRFEELLLESLDDSDRGAARLQEQTRFLAAAFRAYERRLGEAVDEHGLRAHLLTTAASDPLQHVILTVADWIADPQGLSVVDFDMLTRVPGLSRIDVVTTDRVLGSGFHQRVHHWLPGIEEVEGRDIGVGPSPVPRLCVPPADDRRSPDDVPAAAFVRRDREEELVAVARRVRSAQVALDRIGVVFERPLPYLYLAREVFGGAGVPYQTIDGLPLAAEPVAAALDLVIEFACSQFTRDAAIALLRSPHFHLTAGPVSRTALAALDAAMRDARYLGELNALRALEAEESIRTAVTEDAGVGVALSTLIAAAEELQVLVVRGSAASQVAALADFFVAHASAEDQDDERAKAARTALLNLMRQLASAYAQHGDRDVAFDDLAPELRRWIEEATFPRDGGGEGLQLLDAQAARFGDFDELTLVGLVEGEWPERPRRNIFYAPAVLASLGWPSEHDRRSAATAGFLDLVRSPSALVTLSTFSLDDEALVEPSMLVYDVAGLSLSKVESPIPSDRVFVDEALSLDPVNLEALGPDARHWAVMRLGRTAGDDPRYHGAAGPQASRELSVSGIETYLTCPFKFFAQRVLRLDEEREDDEVMDPKAQGQFVHQVFESFFRRWQDDGHRTITPANLDRARALFADVVEDRITANGLPDAEAAIERTRLLGSPVAAGLGEVVFRMEAERPTPVVERLLEEKLRGEFDFTGPRGHRRIGLHGVADRLDLLEDGTFRLVDYKLSSAPNKSRALQLPIYGLCAEQRLQRHRGRSWTLGEAAYISFRGAQRVTPLFTKRQDRDQVMAAAQERLIDAVDAIERGEFSPTPTDVFLCGFCSYGAVCRRDYVGDV
jgi:RecB family exonuclease